MKMSRTPASDYHVGELVRIRPRDGAQHRGRGRVLGIDVRHGRIEVQPLGGHNQQPLTLEPGKVFKWPSRQGNQVRS